MSHLHYEEEQRFSNIPWIWIALLALAIIPTIIIAMDQSREVDVSMLALTVILGFVPVALILFYARLQIKIDTQGFHYKFFPAVMKWRVITKNEIKSYEVSDKLGIEKFEIGHKRSFLNKTISMNITGKKMIRLELKNGHKLKIGTENPEGAERALKKLLSPDSH